MQCVEILSIFPRAPRVRGRVQLLRVYTCVSSGAWPQSRNPEQLQNTEKCCCEYVIYGAEKPVLQNTFSLLGSMAAALPPTFELWQTVQSHSAGKATQCY